MVVVWNRIVAILVVCMVVWFVRVVVGMVVSTISVVEKAVSRSIVERVARNNPEEERRRLPDH